jgi:erythromycin esterase-like protein
MSPRLAPLFVAIVLAGAWTLQEPSAADWIRARAIPLTTAEPGHGFADMQPLKAVIGNARIVSLGEATHGTREFFQLKHRILEFLASEMRFTIFSIEASMPEAYRLNDYVLDGKGDPAALLKGMYFWTWDTEEVLAMIRWMREFNQSGKGRVQFTGFDMQTPTVAQQIVQAFVDRHDQPYAQTLRTAGAAAARAVTSAPAGPAFGVVSATLPVAAVAGKRVRFSGYIKTEQMSRGYAGLWFRADGPTGTVAFDNMSTRGVTGTTDWKPYAIDLNVPANATNVVFGLLMPGDGRAWFDSLSIEIDGQPFAGAAAFDLDFELPALKGFAAGGGSYRAEMDAATANTGKQSLRLSLAGAAPAAAQPPVDVKATVAERKGVVAHLEAGRDRYRASGATARDIDWAIQNARVVLQGLQSRAGEVSRDRSMADNVKWILDQNPGAKIVLWAHNGHVATGGFAYPPMGAALRQMFGSSMVVFGFSFGEGSFQAIAQGGGGLRSFTVPRLPPDSLDATLAAAGPPIFALDLRNAPPSMREPRASRQIGSVYPDGSPDAFAMKIAAPLAFDALLFVNRTTAARANPK